jgi:hypothetical protein
VEGALVDGISGALVDGVDGVDGASDCFWQPVSNPM